MRIVFFILAIYSLEGLGQVRPNKVFPKNPHDTLYYKDGQIKSFRYKNEYFSMPVSQ